MLFRVEELGPIREAEIDLDQPLIVLAGPNNSGKTYLAWVIYSLAHSYVRATRAPSALNKGARRVVDEDGGGRVVETASELTAEFLSALSETVQHNLPDHFAAPSERFEATKLTLTSERGLRWSGRGGGFYAGKKEASVRAEGDGPLVVEFSSMESSGSLKELTQAQREQTATDIVRLAVVMLDSPMVEEVDALPVERLAINLFAREIAANRTELVDRLLSRQTTAADGGAPAGYGAFLQRHAGTYPLVIRNALQAAIRRADRPDRGPLADLADALEQGVLGGAVHVSEDELEFHPQGAGSVALRLHETASVVKSLASLVLYLRYEAEPGRRLIIDEPELNLHPDNQRRVARILARGVNRGLRVVMSTHSDYLIRELNNLVMLGQDSEPSRALRAELGYDESETLQAEQIGAYLVNDGQCRRLPVSETGFEVSTIEDEIHRLNRDSQLIYQRLFCE